jgi:flagellar basal-body rod protein FlgG
MLKGIYTAAANMVPKMIQQDLIANNLANVNTTGYKKDRLYFRQMFDAELYSPLSEQANPGVMEALTLFEPGPLVSTKNPLDVAIVGDAFFTVDTEQGVRYTRNGSFSVDQEGYLVTSAGHQVMGENGPILLDTSQDVEITPAGEIWQKDSVVDQLALVRFPDPRSLEKIGDSLFRARQDAEVLEDRTSSVRQGFLEDSNVRAIEEMIEMISILREYEADQRAIQYQDDTLRRAVNDLGRIG